MKNEDTKHTYWNFCHFHFKLQFCSRTLHFESSYSYTLQCISHTLTPTPLLQWQLPIDRLKCSKSSDFLINWLIVSHGEYKLMDFYRLVNWLINWIIIINCKNHWKKYRNLCKLQSLSICIQTIAISWFQLIDRFVGHISAIINQSIDTFFALMYLTIDFAKKIIFSINYNAMHHQSSFS